MRIFLFIFIFGGLLAALTQIPTLRAKVPQLTVVPQLNLRSASKEHIAIDGTDKKDASDSADQTKDATPEPKRNGSVAGISTERIGQVFTGISSLISQGTQAILTSSPNPSDVIDVSKVALDISNKVEAIPSSVLTQAKIAYCEQVLLQATKSAEPATSPSPSPTQ